METITLDLGEALSPQKLSIEKSRDGVTYKPWVYAVSDLDYCNSFFRVNVAPLPESVDETICVGFTADDSPPGDKVRFLF